jgi:hypothetical protein
MSMALVPLMHFTWECRLKVMCNGGRRNLLLSENSTAACSTQLGHNTETLHRSLAYSPPPDMNQRNVLADIAPAMCKGYRPAEFLSRSLSLVTFVWREWNELVPGGSRLSVWILVTFVWREWNELVPGGSRLYVCLNIGHFCMTRMKWTRARRKPSVCLSEYISQNEWWISITIINFHSPVRSVTRGHLLGDSGINWRLSKGD